MESHQPAPPTPTRDGALAEAARILHSAELPGDRELMDKYTGIAAVWVSIADAINQGEAPEDV